MPERLEQLVGRHPQPEILGLHDASLPLLGPFGTRRKARTERPGPKGPDRLSHHQAPGGVERYHGVQSYGMFVRAGLKGFVPSPGEACNGS
jgi:hypothetical protein